MQVQGVPINLDVLGEGNTLIPRQPLEGETYHQVYLEILKAVLSKTPEELSQYQATSVRLSRVLEEYNTAAEALRQLNEMVEAKEGPPAPEMSYDEAMDAVHETDIGLIPAVPEGKTLWHIIPDNLIPRSVDYNQRAEFLKFINQLNRQYPNVREKIKIVTAEQMGNPAAIMAAIRDNEQGAGREAMFDFALASEDDIEKLPEGVKALVFEAKGGELGDFRQLEGILACLRALNIKDGSEMTAVLSRICAILSWETPGAAGITDDDLKDPRAFARRFKMILPAIKIEDGKEIRRLNENLLKLIESA